ncbi:MAG: DUF697 domain-containing protein [Planctomycetes bacterium]|nr:DUF697 domain-containing protein [Planctomycetota bacterium]
MLKTWFKIIKTGLLVFGALLSFFAFIEILHAYQTLREFHPIAGYAFAGIIAAALLWLAVYLIKTIASQPPVLIPPRIGEPQTASPRRVKKYAKYLSKYMSRLTSNRYLPAEQQETVAAAMDKLSSAVYSGKSSAALAEEIISAQDQAIRPALQTLDDQAEKEIRACVAVVMTGVTLSPYKAADLMIVIYRNFVMAGRIMKIYNSRPRLREQFKIAADIIAVVATVNYINMGKNLIEGLASRAPLIGRYSSDIAQGIGAGFMTSVVGHAAVQRCKAFKGFDRTEAAKKLKSKAAHFYEDVRDMFKKDILPSVLNRIGDATKETFDMIVSVLDDTSTLIGNIIKSPIEAAVTVGTTGGKVVYNTSAKGISLAGKIAAKFTKPFKKKK